MVLYLLKCLVISTHTPHARRDVLGAVDYMFTDDISTHTPHARRDIIHMIKMISIIAKFQLTRLMRGVTKVF